VLRPGGDRDERETDRPRPREGGREEKEREGGRERGREGERESVRKVAVGGKEEDIEGTHVI